MNPQPKPEAPRTQKRRSLATRLTWVSILMVTLAMVNLGTGLIWIADRTQRQNVLRLQQQSADQLSQMISGYISKAENRLQFFLQNVHIFFHSHKQQKSALENLLLTSLPLYSQISLLNRDGDEQVKVSRFHSFLPEELTNQATNPAFQTAVSGQNHMGPVAFFENTGLLTVTLALPLKANLTEIKGVLMAEVNVSHLWQKVSKMAVGREGYAYLVDRKGCFVAYQKPAEVLQRYGEDMKRMLPVSRFVSEQEGKPVGIEKYQGLGGEEVIGTYAPIHGTDWAVVVEQPVRQAFRSISRMQTYLFGVLIIAIVLAGGVGYFAARRLIGPIRMLTEAADQFASGDLKSRFTVLDRQDEVGILATAFQKMQNQLRENQKLEAQLQHAQRMESIGTLAGGIAHNFNNLLMGIMGHTSLMLVECAPDHPNYKRLKVIEKQVENASRLTSQLLGYAREGRYEVAPLNLNRIIQQTAETFGVTRKEITIHKDFSENLSAIMADQVQIEQVLLNLFVNAADAMPGGGDLFITTENATGKGVTGFKHHIVPGSYVLLTVRDTGTGMDKQTCDRIFEPFFTTKGLAHGTGLGLASVYGIIKAHGGYIHVTSKEKIGTTFYVYLPATLKKQIEIEKKNDEPFKGSGTILLVDDEEVVLETGELMLKHLGYRVHLAQSGQSALELLQELNGSIDLILLDMTMPGMGGAETFEKIREINPDIPVLLLSGYSLEGEAKKIMEKGCDDFMQKPFKLDQLSRKIEKIMRKHSKSKDRSKALKQVEQKD